MDLRLSVFLQRSMPENEDKRIGIWHWSSGNNFLEERSERLCFYYYLFLIESRSHSPPGTIVFLYQIGRWISFFHLLLEWWREIANEEGKILVSDLPIVNTILYRRLDVCFPFFLLRPAIQNWLNRNYKPQKEITSKSYMFSTSIKMDLEVMISFSRWFIILLFMVQGIGDHLISHFPLLTLYYGRWDPVVTKLYLL